MESATQRAIINGKQINFNFIAGDLIQEKSDGTQGVVTKVDNPFIYIEWSDEDIRENRGTRWMVNSIEHVTT